MSEPLVQHLQPELLLGPSARSIASTPELGLLSPCCRTVKLCAISAAQ